LHLLIKVYSITRPSDWHVVVWIDNSSALKFSKLDEFFKPNQHIGNESDIINDIFAIKTELQISLRGKHVKSHQTPERNVRASLEVQLNEGCNGHADDLLKKHPPNGTPPQQPPFQQPQKPTSLSRTQSSQIITSNASSTHGPLSRCANFFRMDKAGQTTLFNRVIPVL
jgi:hypothetical protein